MEMSELSFNTVQQQNKFSSVFLLSESFSLFMQPSDTESNRSTDPLEN